MLFYYFADGTFFHPFIDEEETLYVFNPFIFRYINLLNHFNATYSF